MKFVLSIDGGGIRGIIPANILDHIEKVLNAPACELFDLIVGTSTGGILALALTRPRSSTDQSPRFTASDLVRFYENCGQKIFSRSPWKRVCSMGGIIDEKYPSTPLKSVLYDYFSNTSLHSALTNVLITAYDIENRCPFIFKSWGEPRQSKYLMKDVALATSAAPTYFEPAGVVSEDLNISYLIDGGVFANNPAMCAYAEAKRLWPEEQIVIFSLGTGEMTRPIHMEEARDWGIAGWVAPLISVVSDGQSDAVDYQLRNVLDGNYFRVQGNLEVASDDMDDASCANIEALKEEAYKFRGENADEISTICALLREGKCRS